MSVGMPENTVASFRISSQQERIWWQQTAASAAYRAECEVLIDGPLDTARLQSAIRDLVARYEILRTVFERQAGLKIPFQVIHPEVGFAWQTVDLSALSEPAQHVKIEDLRRDSASTLDMEQGPALRVTLAALARHKHALLLVLPAVCADRASLQNLAVEIGRLYRDPSQHSVEVMQYVDVAEWQQELLVSDDTKAGRDFWRDRCRNLDFAGAASTFSAFEIKSGDTFVPDLVSRQVDASLLSKIAKDVLPDLLLACWQLFLSRITGLSTITAAVEFDGRKYAELHDAIGLFSKYLPVESAIVPAMTFAALLSQVKHTVAETRNWQESFAWSQVELPAGLDQALVIAAAFEYADVSTEPSNDETTFTISHLDACCEGFKLKLSARRFQGGLSLEFHYDASCLSRETVERWSNHFLALLAAAGERPDSPVNGLPLLDETERHRLLVEWNQTEADFPRDRCFHELFEAQVGLTPNRPAVRGQDRQLTYLELNQRANQLAHALRGMGVGPDTLVALCLDRNVDMIVALLGIFKAGGAYVPLSADHPKARLAQQLAGTLVLLTEEKFLGRMPEFAGTALCFDKDRALWSAQPTVNPEPSASPSNFAYVIYTSGSTGTPKGVAVRHSNLVNYAAFIKTRLELERYPDGLHFATVSTLGADLGNTCIYPSLISGGCLHVIPHDVAADSRQFCEYTQSYPLDVLKIVPSHLTVLLDAGGGKEVLPRKYLVLGGETFSHRLLDKISSLHSECEVFNHYGPTETTVGSLTLRLKQWSGPMAGAHSIPIGRPIANTQIYILDAQQEPVPIGVAGELYIAGAGVTAGYLNQPERTAERFVADRFGSNPAAKMYRTGDLARYLPDGNVEFLGRADDQVKIRGFRVELGEIEAALTRHESVKQALVVVKAAQNEDKRLVAYIVGHRDRPVDINQIRIYLKDQLPDHMNPSALVELPKLPLTANGKIDRQNLPEPEETPTGAKSYASPETPGEILIAGIWAEVLGRDRVGVDDNFFDIGGHSLIATQVVSRIRRSLEIDLPLGVIFELPTVKGLAEWVEQKRRQGRHSLPPAIVRVARDQPLPLSFVQHRLWLINQLDPKNTIYNVLRTMRMKGDLNVAAFQESLDEILRRHESQRTTFALRDGQPVQIIADSLRVPLQIQDLCALPDQEREPAARKIASESAIRPFDLEKGPLLRFQLLRLAPDDHVFLLTVHHIVSDAWSAGIFLQELSTLYEAFSQGRPSPLPELTIQYADYAVWQRQWLEGDILKSQLAYWREQLDNAPAVLELPLDHPRSQATSFRGSLEVIPFSPEVSNALKKLCRQEDVTLFMTLLAGFQTLLSRYSGQEQIVLATDVAGRTAPEAEKLIGFFINLLVMRTDLSGNPTFRELLGRVRKMALDSYAHQDLPFDKLVEELQPDRSTLHTPIVQAQFLMKNIPVTRRKLSGLEFTPFEMPLSLSKFDLSVFMAEREESLAGTWVYRTDLFDRSTILRIARQFETLLGNAAAEPETRLSGLEIVGEEEKRQREAEQKERNLRQRERLMATKPKMAGS